MKFWCSGLSQTTDLNTRSPIYEARMRAQCDKDKRIKQVVETGFLKFFFKVPTTESHLVTALIS
jgi:hypothetical protein